MPKAFRVSTLSLLMALLVVACGDTPFESLGRRSSDWIGEPTITTTSTIAITIPSVISASTLKWFNDTIVNPAPADDVEAMKDAVFGRRTGDLFVQASRLEVITLLPEVKFPASAPYLSEFVTSQLVFDNDGELARDPVVAFGIWSSEPYTRSRSVAQMAVLRVAFDPETAEEIAAAGGRRDLCPVRRDLDGRVRGLPDRRAPGVDAHCEQRDDAGVVRRVLSLRAVRPLFRPSRRPATDGGGVDAPRRASPSSRIGSSHPSTEEPTSSTPVAGGRTCGMTRSTIAPTSTAPCSAGSGATAAHTYPP